MSDIAGRYGGDLEGVQVNILKNRMGYFGSTSSDLTVNLTRDTVANEEQLARTLFHERFHVDQLMGGLAYPTTEAEAALAVENEWRAAHRLNPANVGVAP